MSNTLLRWVHKVPDKEHLKNIFMSFVDKNSLVDNDTLRFYRNRTGSVRLLAASTPGKYLLSLFSVLIAVLVAVTISSFTIINKRATYQRILDYTIHLTSSARILYTSISDMDIQLSDLAIQDHVDSHLVDAIHQDITQVSQAVIYLSEHTEKTNPSVVQDLRTINVNLPVYLQKISPILESNTRPSGIELTLTQTSSISDNYLIPASHNLLLTYMRTLNDQSSEATNIVYFPLMMLLLASVATLLTFRLVFSRSGRGTVLIFLAILFTFAQFCWFIGAGLAGSVFGNQAHNLGVTDLTNQTSILINSQQARRDELLKVSLPQSSYIYKTNFFNNLSKVNKEITQYRPRTLSGKIFLVNANHILFQWSREATAFARYTPQPTDNSTPIGYLDPEGTLPSRSQFLNEIYLTEPLWNSMKNHTEQAIYNTTAAYTASAHTSYNVWKNTFIAIILCAIGTIATTIVGIILRLREYK